MLGRTNLFRNITCPYYQEGLCDRPYCHYKHDPLLPPVPEPHSSEQHQVDHYIGSYSTAPVNQFQGYRGFFDRSIDPADPVIAVRNRNGVDNVANFADSTNTNIVQEDDEEEEKEQQQRQQQQQKEQQLHNEGLFESNSSLAVPISAVVQQRTPQPETANINELAKSLASINNAIQELQSKLTAHKRQYGDLTNDDDSGVILEDPRQSNGNHLAAKSIKSGRSFVYKPTPIKELERMKRKRASGDDSSGVERVKSKRRESKPELTNMVVDFLGDKEERADRNGCQTSSSSSSSSSSPTSSKRLSENRKSVSAFDLFGADDSSEEEKKETISKQIIKKDTYTKKVDERRPSTSKIASGDVNIFQPQQLTSSASVDQPALKKSKTTMVTTKSNVDQKKCNVASLVSTANSMDSMEKKRIAHANAADKNLALLRKTGGERVRGQATFLTPREQLQMRFTQMQKQKDALMKQQQSVADKNTKKSEQTKQQDECTVVGTAPKGEKRIAHVPIKSTLKRPVIEVEIGSKVPAAVRQRYLNLFIDECLKFAKTEEEAFEQAKCQECAVFNKSASKGAYLNSAVNAIKRLRDEKGLKSAFDGFTGVQSSTASGNLIQSVSHDTVVAGKGAVTCSFSLKRSSGSTSADITGEELYSKLLDFVLTSSQLDENGYPRCDPLLPSRAIYMKESVLKLFVENEQTNRSCCRCGKLFQISPEGVYLGSGDCFYHWGKLWKKRVCGAVESRFNCCQGDFASKGCCIAKYHVTDNMPRSALDNYVQTKPSEGLGCSAYALDCEMIYTVGGTELARVTVVDDRLSVVYDRIVKPDCQVLDYNSRFSGLTETEVTASPFTLRDIQRDLLKLFQAETILIGHSLESDLRALKLIHERVVDTSIVFPHRLEGTHKRALKTLMSEYLSKIIQDDIEGHDSKEDACSCMQLMKWKVKNVKK